MTWRHSWRLFAAVAFIGLLTGCSRLDGPAASAAGVPASGTETVTQAQATARAVQIIQQTAAALSPRPPVDFAGSLPNQAGDCVTDTANIGHTVSVNRTAFLHVSPSQDSNLAGRILAFWRQSGFQIFDYSGFAANQPVIDAQTADFFTVSLVTSASGLLTVSASSPCVYPGGTPAP